MDDTDDTRPHPSRCPYRDDSRLSITRVLPAQDPEPIRSDPAQPQPLHPAVAFKRFVDSQFAALASLPSAIAALPTSMQAELDARRKREQAIFRRWTGRQVTPDHDDLLLQRADREHKELAFDAGLLLVRESERRNAHIPPARIAALYRDDDAAAAAATALEADRFGAGSMLSFGGACYYMPETGDNLPSTATLFGRSPSPAPAPHWLSIDWFKNSIYSPTNVEKDALRGGMALKHASPNWRAAFEDLLCVTLGKEMGSAELEGQRPPFGETQSTWRGPGLDWMLSLQCRGILPPQLPSWYRSGGWKSQRRGQGALTALEGIRGSWADEVGRWGPRTAEMEFAELVREIARPPAPAMTHAMWEFKRMSLYPHGPPAWQDEPPPFKWPPEEQEERSSLRPAERLAPAAVAFWTLLEAEDTDGAAAQVREWEARRRDVRDLIGSRRVMENYVNRETEPRLWVLCEALEKAASKLWDFQSRLHSLPWEHYMSDPSQIRVMRDILVQRLLDKGDTLTYGKEVRRRDEDAEDEFDDEFDDEVEEEEDDEEDEEEDEAQVQQGTLRGVGQIEDALAARVAQEKETLASRAAQEDGEAQTESQGVLAALTTRQTTRLPNGTVTTKVVLKKRFADGREESTESVQVEYPEQQRKQLDEDETGKTRKQGWFWS